MCERFWTLPVYGLLAKDVEEYLIVDPKGEAVLFAKRQTAEQHKAQWFSAAGKKRKGKAWAPGRYRARYRLLRRPVGGGSRRIVFEINRSLVLR